MHSFNLDQLKFLDLNRDRDFYLFAYGRLKTNYHYNEYLNIDTNKYLGEVSTKEYVSLYMMDGYPLMSNMGNIKGQARGELYRINCETLLHLDNLFRGQDRRTIILEDNTEAFCYYMNIKLLNKEVPIINGVIEWKI